MIITTGSLPEAVNQSAKHVLYVEGNRDDCIDPIAITSLLNESSIRVKALGPSYSVKSVAQALCVEHPTYYFLIDRDHHTDDEVERSWTDFPNPDTHNLLIWRRKEIESYFLIAEFIAKSEYLKCDVDRLRHEILSFQQARLYFEIANQVVVFLREALKVNWIEMFSGPNGFETKARALSKLTSCSDFNTRISRVSNDLSVQNIEREYERLYNEMTGNREHLEFNAGNWLERMSAKAAFNHIASTCFKVQDAKRNVLQGKDARHQIVKSLFKLSDQDIPNDFAQLRGLVKQKLK